MRIAARAGQRVVVAVGAITLAAAALLQGPAGAQAQGGGSPDEVAGRLPRLIPTSSGNLRAIANRSRAARRAGGDRRPVIPDHVPGVGLRGGTSDATPNPRTVPVVASTPGV